MIHAILPVALTKTLTITYKKFSTQIPRFPSAVNGLSPPITHLQVPRIETTIGLSEEAGTKPLVHGTTRYMQLSPFRLAHALALIREIINKIIPITPMLS